jgi:TrwC relaxase/AAA domain
MILVLAAPPGLVEQAHVFSPQTAHLGVGSVTTLVSLRKGHDVGYFAGAHGDAAGCAGAMAYYTAGGEPPGQWAGRGAAALGLAGRVDPKVIKTLFMDGVGPGGERLVRRRSPGTGTAEGEVRDWRRRRRRGSAVEEGEVRARARAKEGPPKAVPYFDLTTSLVKSASLLHASYRIAALLARQAGADGEAGRLDRRADDIEAALLGAASEAVQWLEENACYTRTGYHSASTGEWRDGGGLTASLYLHHLSRDGDPQLHVHVAIWNRTQRADGADDKWRTLFGRMLYQQRLGVAPVADRFAEARLRGLGYVMVPRADGNGCEVGGVDAAMMRRFSSRGVAVDGETARLAAQWEAVHGKPPSRRTLWLLHQQAGQATRRRKSEARRTVGGRVLAEELSVAERLAAWEAQTAADEMQALSAVHGQVEEFARAHAAPGAPPVQPRRRVSLAEKQRVARVAVAEVQKRHATWTMAQLRFEVHRALGPAFEAADVDEIAALAVSGRAGTDVVQIGAAPDVADVSPLGTRASDERSVYRPPGEERWCTIGHLDLEERIVAEARRPVAQLVTVGEAEAAVAGSGLTGAQAAAVVAMLTSRTATLPLNAAAGSGKSRAMAVFSELWPVMTGGRVIGLATATNAARVLEGEGLGEAYNVAQFLGKVKGSDKLRHPVPVGPRDVLILDEATQASTADIALLQEAARQAGARLNPVGDTEQLGAVDAGGAFGLLVEEIGGPAMEEVLRFRHEWEAAASLRIRAGDTGGLAAYDRRGRLRGGPREETFDRAAGAWLADHLRGRESLLLAGSNEEAADLARRVQAQLARMGRVGPGEAELADGNMAGTGDLIRARLNTCIDAGGRRLTNRDRLLVEAVDGADATVRRQTGPDAWSASFGVPLSYLAESAELDYAGNVHVAQGRTVDAGHLVVTPSVDRRGVYVGMTRGREENTAYPVTGNTAPAGRAAYEQATAEQVMAAAMEREQDDASATQQMRAAQEWAGGTGHVLHLWSTAVRQVLYPEIDRLVTERLDPDLARRYLAEHARKAFHARLRVAHLAGHDLGELIARVTADALGGARSVASVLHSRLEGLGLDPAADGVTWAQRTPDGATPLARELAGALDARAGELGGRLALWPVPWVTRRLGVLAPDASPALRADWERRAGTAAAYREAAGITDPDVDVAAEPHAGNPELETARRAAMRALEIRPDDERLRAMSAGELEALVAEGDRAVALAPEDVTGARRAAGQARADAWSEAARARAAGDAAGSADAEALARRLDAEEARLEPATQAYEEWSARTAAERAEADRAAAELASRAGGLPGPEEPEDLVEWWREFDRDVEAVDRALAAEQKAALEAGRPWPPPRPKAEPAAPAFDADGLPFPDPEPDPEPDPDPDPEPERWAEPDAMPAGHPDAEPEPEPEPEPAPEPRLSELQAGAEEAAARLDEANQADAEAGDEWARTQAEAEPEMAADPAGPGWEPEPG